SPPGFGSRESGFAGDNTISIGVESRIPTPESRIDVIADYDQFAVLEADWNDAVERARIPHPFLRHEWVRTWWDSFGPSAPLRRSDRQLHVIVVRDQGRIIGIAPFMREATVLYGLPVRRLSLLANDHTPRTDFVVAGDADTVYPAIWNALIANIDRWDV